MKMKQKEITALYNSIPQFHTESFLTWQQAEQFKDVFKNMVVVIRCRDCKHHDPENGRCDNGNSIIWNLPRPDDWFCADGERQLSGNDIDRT